MAIAIGIMFKNAKIPCRSLAAPGTYSPEKVNMSKSPEYSFGVKTKIEEKNGLPGARVFFFFFINIVAATF